MAYRILAHINNNNSFRKYRIPKSKEEDNEFWTEITIDLERQTFKANRFKSNSAEGKEWKVYNDATFPSSLLNELYNSEYPKQIKWDYVPGLKEKGKITPQMLVKWAYLENGYFLEQDEDLMMHKSELIETMHDLMIDNYSNRKSDLFKTLKNYSKEVFKNKKDIEAIKIFSDLEKVNSNDIYHIEFIKHIEELKRTS